MGIGITQWKLKRVRNRKNDYSITIFSRNNEFLGKMEFVHNLYKASQWLTYSRNYSNWHYINIYDRRTKQYLTRRYRNEFIEQFLD